jgi:anti-sigma regulatory factor (Ser/Thr protein kinase)/ketosteroid isomerase-like protein
LQAQALAIPPGPEGLSQGRGFIDEALEAAGFDPAERYGVTVATNEAVSNAMEHGAPCRDGHVHLAAGVEEDTFVFSVRDCGEFREASPQHDPVIERGRGFAFMNLLMDDVRVEARPGETVLRLTKRLPGAEPPPEETARAASGQNIAVVREVFDAFAARDVERTVAVVDRGVMMEPLSTPVERRTPYLGVDGLRRYLRDLDSTWQEFDIRIDDLRGGGHHVVALGRIHARHDNVVQDDQAGFVFKLREGKVVWAKVYRSTDEALAAAGLA